MARKSTDYIIIHCAATKPSANIDISDVDRWHRAQGWRMVGYHYFIKRDGTLQVGRELMDGGAHAGEAYNNRSVGVCMAGGVAEDGKTPQNNFAPEQWHTLTSLVQTLKRTFPQAKVIGHYQVARKACPSFDVQEWLLCVSGVSSKEDTLQGKETAATEGGSFIAMGTTPFDGRNEPNFC